MTYNFGRYSVTPTFKGDKESPFDKGNSNNFIVKVEDTMQGNFCFVDYWHDKPSLTEKEAAEAFVKIIQTALIGMSSPAVFCEMMGLDPHDVEGTPPKYVACRAVTSQIVHVVKENFRDVLGRLARRNGLNMARVK